MGYNVRIGNEQCQPCRLQYKTACRLYIADGADDRANAASPKVRSDFGLALRELLAAAGSDACERASGSGKP